jgi:shikimate kinase
MSVSELIAKRQQIYDQLSVIDTEQNECLKKIYKKRDSLYKTIKNINDELKAICVHEWIYEVDYDVCEKCGIVEQIW